jgi:CHAT domain-containing protein/tetratricopeptide (TPR) repeat protein
LKAALTKFEEAASLFRALHDSQREVLMLNFIGLTRNAVGESSKALTTFSQALSLSRAIGDRSNEAVALSGLGIVYSVVDPSQAITKCAEALEIFKALGDQANQATTLATQGLGYLRVGDLQQALETYARSLPAAQAVGDSSTEIKSLCGTGVVSLLRGDKEKALKYFTRALTAARSLGDRANEADALAGFGLVYVAERKPTLALDSFNQALSIFRANGGLVSQAGVLNGLGESYGLLANRQKSLDSFTEALPLARQVGDRNNQANALNGIGFLSTASDPQKSLDCHLEALQLARTVRNRQFEADALCGLGYAYDRLGDAEKSVESFVQAIEILHSLGNLEDEALAHVLLGFAYVDEGKMQLARDSLTKGLHMAREIKSQNVEAKALSGLAVIGAVAGFATKPFEDFEKALALARATGNRGGEADALNNMGLGYLSSGLGRPAIDPLTKALGLYRELKDRQGEASALINLAAAELFEDKLFEARAHAEAGLDVFESLRSTVVNRQLRTSYFTRAQYYYEFYIDLLMLLNEEEEGESDEDYAAKALEVSERSRARALLDTLAEATANIREHIDPALLQRERTLRDRLDAKEREQMEILSGAHTEEQAKLIGKDVDELARKFQFIQTEIRQTSPRYAALTQPRALSVKQIQQILDPDTMLLEYFLGTEMSFLWAVTSGSVKTYKLGGRNEIEKTAKNLYTVLNTRNVRVGTETPQERDARVARAEAAIPAASLALSDMLLLSVVGRTKRVVIVADGALQYIPFAMLPKRTHLGTTPQPLIVDHEIVSLPSASTLAVIRQDSAGRKPAPKTVVVLADPVFSKNDPRVKHSVKTAKTGKENNRNPANEENAGNLKDPELQLVEGSALDDPPTRLRVPRLLDTRREAIEIVSMVHESDGKLALDFQANRAFATSDQLRQYRYVHFSTHGFLDDSHPESSGLVLSLVDKNGADQDGFLRVREIYNLKLAADLVVLSSCQSGLGKEVRGEGLINLTRGFMYAGAPRVVVSLWSVSEWGTTELMVRFYRGMLKEGLRPAAALRAAQISLMKEKQCHHLFTGLPSYYKASGARPRARISCLILHTRFPYLVAPGEPPICSRSSPVGH